MQKLDIKNYVANKIYTTDNVYISDPREDKIEELALKINELIDEINKQNESNL